MFTCRATIFHSPMPFFSSFDRRLFVGTDCSFSQFPSVRTSLLFLTFASFSGSIVLWQLYFKQIRIKLILPVAVVTIGSLCFAKTFSNESPMVYPRTRRHRDQQLVLRNSATSMQPQVMEAVPARKGELKRRGRRDRHVCVHVGQHYSLTGWQQHRGGGNSLLAVHEVPVE